ncbi:hypothetical protein FF38_07954 [Lucilia cuprina]|uniref:SWIM-type domain-containing protein n=1 Tax=Lucilia cuprina TaxID=7375 RepID=A0A0L0C345_LUCCU|nr:hypothetical protein FF38_07954 [Lucilia cuprina]
MENIGEDLLVDEAKGLIDVKICKGVGFKTHFKRALSFYAQRDQDFIIENWNKPSGRQDCLKILDPNSSGRNFADILRGRIGKTAEERKATDAERKRKKRRDKDFRSAENAAARQRNQLRLSENPDNETSSPTSSSTVGSPNSEAVGNTETIADNPMDSPNCNSYDDFGSDREHEGGNGITLSDGPDDNEQESHDPGSSRLRNIVNNISDQDLGGAYYAEYEGMKDAAQAMGLNDPLQSDELDDSEQVAETIPPPEAEDDNGYSCNEDEQMEDNDVEDNSLDTNNNISKKRRPKQKPNCCGHVYNDYGFLKTHKEKRYCGSKKNRARLSNKPEHVNISSEQDLYESIEKNQQKYSHPDFFKRVDACSRRELIEGATYTDTLYHIKATRLTGKLTAYDKEPETIDDLSEYINDIIGVLSRTLYPFRFHSKRKNVYIYVCAFHLKSNSNRCVTRSQDLTNNRLGADTLAKCKGQLVFMFDKKKQKLAIKHKHKPHLFGDFESVENLTEGINAVKDYLEELREGRAFDIVPRRSIVQLVNGKIPMVSKSKIGEMYDKLMNSLYRSHTCDWISLLKVAQRHEDYTVLVFNCKGKTGVAIYFREIMEKCKKLDAFALDSTYRTNNANAELFIINACIDNIGIPVGYMFVANSEAIFKTLEKDGNEFIAENDLTPPEPLPMSAASKYIRNAVEAKLSPIFRYRDKNGKIRNKIIRKRFEVRDEEGVAPKAQTALISCFLYPFTHTLDFGHTPEESANFPAPSSNPITFPNLNPKFVLIDKDFSSINAVRISMPSSRVLICQWHVLEAMRRKIRAKVDLKTYIKEGDIKHKYPSEFNDIIPFFSQKAYEDHEESECETHLGLSELEHLPDDHENENRGYLCLKHNNKHYMKHVDDGFERKILVDGKKQKFTEVFFNMVKRHNRVNSLNPARFPVLGKEFLFAKQYKPEDIKKLMRREMIVLCSKYNKFGLLMYLWINWYQDDQIPRWTVFAEPEYIRHTTNMICEGNHNKLKRALNLQNGKSRLDRIMYVFRKVLYVDFLTRSTEVDTAVRNNSYLRFFSTYRPSWMVNRWSSTEALFNKVYLKDKLFEKYTEADFMKDCRRYGTDIINFQCSCDVYMFKNIHLCKHILCGLHANVFSNDCQNFFKIHLRARKTAPFYLMSNIEYPETDGSENQDTLGYWKYSTVSEKYLNWRNSEGIDILKSKNLTEIDYFNSTETPFNEPLDDFQFDFDPVEDKPPKLLHETDVIDVAKMLLLVGSYSLNNKKFAKMIDNLVAYFYRETRLELVTLRKHYGELRQSLTSRDRNCDSGTAEVLKTTIHDLECRTLIKLPAFFHKFDKDRESRQRLGVTLANVQSTARHSQRLHQEYSAIRAEALANTIPRIFPQQITPPATTSRLQSPISNDSYNHLANNTQQSTDQSARPAARLPSMPYLPTTAESVQLASQDTTSQDYTTPSSEFATTLTSQATLVDDMPRPPDCFFNSRVPSSDVNMTM